jgi:hypothetical protein
MCIFLLAAGLSLLNHSGSRAGQVGPVVLFVYLFTICESGPWEQSWWCGMVYTEEPGLDGANQITQKKEKKKKILALPVHSSHRVLRSQYRLQSR